MGVAYLMRMRILVGIREWTIQWEWSEPAWSLLRHMSKQFRITFPLWHERDGKDRNSLLFSSRNIRWIDRLMRRGCFENAGFPSRMDVFKMGRDAVDVWACEKRRLEKTHVSNGLANCVWMMVYDDVVAVRRENGVVLERVIWWCVWRMCEFVCFRILYWWMGWLV